MNEMSEATRSDTQAEKHILKDLADPTDDPVGQGQQQAATAISISSTIVWIVSRVPCL